MSTATNNDNKNTAPPNYGAGYLEISEKGFGFLRTAENHFHPKPTDIFVTPDTIKRNFLREGSLRGGPHAAAAPRQQPAAQVRGEGQRHGLRGLHQVRAVREPDHH